MELNRSSKVSGTPNGMLSSADRAPWAGAMSCSRILASFFQNIGLFILTRSLTLNRNRSCLTTWYPLHHDHSTDIIENNQHGFPFRFSNYCLSRSCICGSLPMHRLPFCFGGCTGKFTPHRMWWYFPASQVLLRIVLWSQCKCLSGHPPAPY